MRRQLAQAFSAVVFSKATLFSSCLALPRINNDNGNSVIEDVPIVTGVLSIMLRLLKAARGEENC